MDTVREAAIDVRVRVPPSPPDFGQQSFYSIFIVILFLFVFNRDHDGFIMSPHVSQ